MGFPSFLLAFFLVSHLLVLHSSGSCPSSFDCGSLGPIKFPFTKNTHPLCGLCTVSCDEQFPKVVLGEDGRSYQVSNIADDTIKINDPALQALIKSNNCDFSSYISPFNTSSISFTISHNLTIFKCNTSSLELQREANEYFPDDHNRYKGCDGGGYTFYYSHPNHDQVQVPTPGTYPTNCVLFQLPVASTVDWFGDPFNLLTYEFSVEYHLSEECLDCLEHGGQCPRDKTREFQCKRRGRKRLALILGTGHTSTEVGKI